MSEYGFGSGAFGDGNDPGLNEPAPANAEPKWYRERMDKVSEQMTSMAAELKALRAKDQRNEMAAQFEAAGIDPGAVTLYQGEPDKVGDWLTANAAFLAKKGEPGDGGPPQGGGQPPQTIVTPEGQAALAAMQAAGQSGVVSTQGSDAEQAAAIAAAAAQGEDAFNAFMRGQGNPYF